MIWSEWNALMRRGLRLAVWPCILSLAAIALNVAPVALALAETLKASPMNVTLPQSVGSRTLSGPAKRIEPQAIFDYMDGAGELYLAYRFRHLDVYEYKNSGQSDILVELYWMDSADDAYGLLSGDWGGDAVDLASALDRGACTPAPIAIHFPPTERR
jgi:hypothetical protein